MIGINFDYIDAEKAINKKWHRIHVHNLYGGSRRACAGSI